jgi:hypothetical protein
MCAVRISSIPSPEVIVSTSRSAHLIAATEKDYKKKSGPRGTGQKSQFLFRHQEDTIAAGKSILEMVLQSSVQSGLFWWEEGEELEVILIDFGIFWITFQILNSYPLRSQQLHWKLRPGQNSNTNLGNPKSLRKAHKWIIVAADEEPDWDVRRLR